MISGPIAALEVVGNITGSEKTNLLGLCLGGAMATLAYLDAVGMELINSGDLPEHLDRLQRAGPARRLHRRASISRLEKTMKRTGFLPKEDMQRSFNLLRTNDLIWNYVVSSWLMGRSLRPSTCSAGTTTPLGCLPRCTPSISAAVMWRTSSPWGDGAGRAAA